MCITEPARPDARLAALWVGHATVLVQLDDKFILTDPVFTDTVGQISKRLVEPGLDPEVCPRWTPCWSRTCISITSRSAAST